MMTRASRSPWDREHSILTFRFNDHKVQRECEGRQAPLSRRLPIPRQAAAGKSRVVSLMRLKTFVKAVSAIARLISTSWASV